MLGDFASRERRVTEAGLLFGKAKRLTRKVSNADRKHALEPRIFGGLAAVAEARAGAAGDDEAAEKKEWASAQKNIEDWLKIEENEKRQAAALQRLARALFKQGDAQMCLEKLKNAKGLDPDVLTVGIQMASLYQEEGDAENAEVWKQYGLQQTPDDLRTWLVAAQMSIQAGQIDQAKQQADTALKIDPKSLQAMMLREAVDALIRGARNGPDEIDEAKWLRRAEELLETVKKGADVKPDRAYYIAVFLADHDRKEDAKTLLRAALKSKLFFAERSQAEALLNMTALGNTRGSSTDFRPAASTFVRYPVSMLVVFVDGCQ